MGKSIDTGRGARSIRLPAHHHRWVSSRLFLDRVALPQSPVCASPTITIIAENQW